MGRWFHVSQNDVYWEDPHFYYNTWSIFTTMGRWFHAGISRSSCLLVYILNTCNNRVCVLPADLKYVYTQDIYILIQVWVFPVNIILTDMKSSSHCCKYWSCIVIEVWVFPINIILTDMKSSSPEWCLLGRPTLLLQYMINIYNNGKMISCQSEWCLLGRPTLLLQYMINI
jgi:hypothetical protein